MTHRLYPVRSATVEMCGSINEPPAIHVSTADLAAAEFEARCATAGFRMTNARRAIVRVLSLTMDHPDVEELYRRCLALDDRIAISTLYRTLKVLEKAGLIKAQSFRDNRTRYEHNTEVPHDHMIDMISGKVIDFSSEDMLELQTELARNLGFKLLNARAELYCVPLKPAHD